MNRSLAHLIRCLGRAETQAMRTRTEADYRSAARYANACAEAAPYVVRESYWRCADRWTRLADADNLAVPYKEKS